MKLCLPLSLAAALATANAYDDSRGTAIQRIKDACAVDIERLCKGNTKNQSRDAKENLGGAVNAAPFLTTDEALNPMQIMNELSNVMDQMMNDIMSGQGNMVHSFAMHPMDTFTVIISDESADQSSVIFDHFISHVASQTPDSHFDQVARQVAERGSYFMSQPCAGDSKFVNQRRHLARRLSEVTEADLHRALSIESQECLYKNYKISSNGQAMLSPLCYQTIYNVEQQKKQMSNVAVQSAAARSDLSVYAVQEPNMFLYLLALYSILLATILVVVYRQRTDYRERRRMLSRVLRAVYSKPKLKAAVESEVGEKLGHVPPLGWRGLQKWGLYSHLQRKYNKSMRFVRCIRIALLTGAIIFYPSLSLPFMIGYALWIFGTALCTTPRTRSCTCCTCGLSTEDVKQDRVKSEQINCECCQGTGVCNLYCPHCLDVSDDTDDTDEMMPCCASKKEHDVEDSCGTEYKLLEGGCCCDCTCDECSMGKCCGSDKCDNDCNCCCKGEQTVEKVMYNGEYIQVV